MTETEYNMLYGVTRVQRASARFDWWVDAQLSGEDVAPRLVNSYGDDLLDALLSEEREEERDTKWLADNCGGPWADEEAAYRT